MMSMPELEHGEVVDAGLAALRPHDAPSDRVARIRACCVVTLAACRSRPEARRVRTLSWRDWFEPALAFGLSVLFLADVVARSLAVYR
jgi:hypothetical protein